MTHEHTLSRHRPHPERSEGSPYSVPLRTMLLACVVLFAMLSHAHAQGCAQCLDATQSTPPAVQAGYRHAIYLLAGAASTLFLATLALIRKFR